MLINYQNMDSSKVHLFVGSSSNKDGDTIHQQMVDMDEEIGSQQPIHTKLKL
jgi:hypothetical protein